MTSALGLLFVGLWNAQLALSEKGFYAMAYASSLFAAIAVQKNTRDALTGSGDGADTGRFSRRMDTLPAD